MIDTHVHVAHADQTRYPRCAETGLGSGWRDSARPPTEQVAEILASGIDRVVIVQALGVYGDDNRCAADTVASDPTRMCLVAGLRVPAGVSELRRLLSGLAMPASGVRLFGIGADPEWADGADPLIEVCAAAAVTPVVTLFGHQLAGLSRLAARHPELPIVVDHCGFPERGPGLAAAEAASNLVLKVTSHVLDHQPAPAVWLAELRDRVGAHRLCWGSDHPQHPGTYAAKLTTLRRAVAGWSTADREQFLDGTAAQLFPPPVRPSRRC